MGESPGAEQPVNEIGDEQTPVGVLPLHGVRLVLATIGPHVSGWFYPTRRRRFSPPGAAGG